jgi:hypothetical protein
MTAQGLPPPVDIYPALNDYATYLSRRGKDATAIKYHEELLDHYRRSTGEESIDTLRTKSNLAMSLLGVDGEANADRARVLLEETLAVLTRKMGPRDRFTLITKDKLAAALAEAGELKRALKMREEVVFDATEALGPSHPTLNKIVANL